MKINPYIFTLFAVISAITLTNCSSSEKKMNAAQDDVHEASIELNRAEKNFNDQTNKFRIESEGKLAANEKSISELKENTKALNEKTRENYQIELIRLEEKNTSLKKRITNSKNEDHEKWESFKREFNHDMDELGRALRGLTKNNIH